MEYASCLVTSNICFSFYLIPVTVDLTLFLVMNINFLERVFYVCVCVGDVDSKACILNFKFIIEGDKMGYLSVMSHITKSIYSVENQVFKRIIS